MTTWTCPATKPPCKAADKPLPTYTDQQKLKMRGFCGACRTRLVVVQVKAEEEPVETHEQTIMQIIAEARIGAKRTSEKHYSEYVKFVLDDVVGGPRVFQDDFLREWQTGEVQSKLYDPSKRLSGKALDCVQQALDMAGLAFPKAIPSGEKFQFELPYIMGTGLGWRCVGSIGDAYKKHLKEMTITPNQLYLVSAQSAPTGAVEGHMILIVSDGSSNTRLVDYQNQKSASRALGCLNHYYCAWSLPRPQNFTPPSWAMEIEFG